MFNVTKSAVLGSLALTLVGAFGLVSMHREANAATSRQSTVVGASTLTFVREDVPPPQPSVTLQEVKVTAPKATRKPARAKRYECGGFEALQNDAAQTVRRCEWK